MSLPIRAIQTRFDPRRVSDCNLWMDFSNRSAITLDGNGLVQQLNDNSGRGIHGTQGTASDRPALGTINGLTCGDWGQAANSKALINTTPSQDWRTTTVVCVWDGAATFPDYNGLFTRWDAGFSGIYMIGQVGSTSWYSGAYSGNFFVNRTNTANVLGTLRAGVAVVQGFTSTQELTTGFSLGHDRRGTITGRGWQGRIGEVFCHGRVLSAPERDWLATEVARKWGVK